MESAKLSKNELIELILYGLKENNIDINNINNKKIERIINDYIMFCNHFESAYVRGELDTFKRAACLLVAINRNKICKDEKVNASVALDAAYKMCEKPYWNIGENFDIPKKLEEIDIKKIFKKDAEPYKTSKQMLIDSLVYENGSPLSYSLNLELFYQVALYLKHDRDKFNIRENQYSCEVQLSGLEEEKSPKKKLLDLFRKK